MYSELPGDIVFYVNGSPNNIYGIDMTTGWVRWRTPYTDDLWSILLKWLMIFLILMYGLY